MTDFPWLSVIGAVPLVGSGVVAMAPKGRDLLAKRVAFLVSLVPLALTVVAATLFAPGGPRFQLAHSYPWIPQFGVHYAVGIDGIGLVLLGLTAVLVPIVILASWNDAERGKRSVKAFFSLVLLLEAMLVGVFIATDVFLFYVFFEAMLVPMYFIIGGYGGTQRSYAAVKFLLYSLAGGMLMLAALIALYVLSIRGGTGTFAFSELARLGLDPAAQRWLFLGFFVAFAIKAPLWPFHTWLPDAAAEAPAGGAVLLVGVMDKVGTFGMLRYCLPLFPDAARFFTPAIIVLAVIGVLYGALLAIGQRDIMRLIAYTSVSHFGLMVLGIFAMTSQGQSGATLYMVNHGVTTAALFLIAGFLFARSRSNMIDSYGGVQKVAPWLAGTFLVASLAGLALPGLSTFVSEFLVLVGTFTRYKVAAGLATFGVILASLYMLWMYQRTMHGPVKAHVQGLRDLSVREAWVVAPLVFLIIALGVYPKPVLDVITPAVKQTMVQVNVTDPGPPHPVSAVSTPGGSDQ